jgi:undecaprenyl-diphosphatase
MPGAVAVAALSVWLTLRAAGWYLLPSYRLATRIHRVLSGKLIAQGWGRK